jgi:SAM-dependent methyltransferase
MNQLNFENITQNQQETWSSGDFHEIGRQTIPLSDQLVQAVDPHPGERVLDLACGSGNAALIAARRECDVTGIDYVPELIQRAKMRAQAEVLEIDFQVADAQNLPFPDSSFDYVLSAIGVMFAPDQEKAASELLRVCKPGGTIGLASWMPEHFGGDFFAAHGRHAPPPAGVKPPVRWGTEQGLQELLGDGIASIDNQRCTADICFAHSVEHAMERFQTYFGPTIRAFSVVDPEHHDALWNDIADVVRRYNRATNGTVVLEAEYLQTIARRG